MYYVYVLRSVVNGDVYVGFTDNLRRRYKEHNDGKSSFTKGYRPWILIYYEAFRSKNDATQREKELKQHKAKSFLMEHLHHSLIV